MRSKKKLTLKRRKCEQSVDKGVFALYLFLEKNATLKNKGSSLCFNSRSKSKRGVNATVVYTRFTLRARVYVCARVFL